MTREGDGGRERGEEGKGGEGEVESDREAVHFHFLISVPCEVPLHSFLLGSVSFL